MRKKKKPKNRTITVRVTENQHNELNKIANSHDLSVSEWSNYILSKNKHSYEKTENKDKLIDDADLAHLKTELIYRILKKFQIKNKALYNRTRPVKITQVKLALKILDLTTFKSDETIDDLIRNYHFSVHRSLT